MTFTIIGIDKKNKELGIASFSKVICVGAIVSSIDFDIGAVGTQAVPNLSFKKKGMELLKKNTPEKTINSLISSDNNKEKRQVLVMNKKGASAVFTGKNTEDWKGSLKGKDCICAGNTLAGEKVVSNMIRVFEKSKKPLAERLLNALKAGYDAGGDKRIKQYNSAVLIVEKEKGGLFGKDNSHLDLRIDCSENSIKDLEKLYRVKTAELKKWHKYNLVHYNLAHSNKSK